MWIPKTENEIIQVVESGVLQESSIFDAKRELPAKSQEIAKDIAAMANDGGVIIYGIGEDENHRLTSLCPINLIGAPERIDSIVHTAITEPPTVRISTIPTSTNGAIGYMIVEIPCSERAPHMVIVKGENRFYGRTATGNNPLTEAEVSRLYERRSRWEVNREILLSEEIKNSPYPPNPDFAYLYLFARPVTAKDDLLEQAITASRPAQRLFYDLLDQILNSPVYSLNYAPHFYLISRWILRAEGWVGIMSEPTNKSAPGAPRDALSVQVDFNGSGHLFCGRASERENADKLFFPSIVAGNTVYFFALLGKLYEQTLYRGMVDIGAAIMGLAGSVPHTSNAILRHTARPYDRDEYCRTARISATQLHEEPLTAARHLLDPLFKAISQGHVDLFEDSMRKLIER